MWVDEEELKDFLKEREVNKKRLYCNWCTQETNHEVKGQHVIIVNAPREMQEVLIYRLWICMGCERGLLEQEYLNESMGEHEQDLEYFPKRSRNALAPKSYSKLKPELEAIYREFALRGFGANPGGWYGSRNIGTAAKEIGEMPALSHIGSRNPGQATSTDAS